MVATMKDLCFIKFIASLFVAPSLKLANTMTKRWKEELKSNRIGEKHCEKDTQASLVKC